MPYVFSQAADTEAIAEREWGKAAQIMFTGFSSCIGIMAIKNNEVIGVHLPWQVNIDAMANHLSDITGWPETANGSFDRDVLFISGANSHYVDPKDRDHIKSLFPKAAFTSIKGAGHWVHAEKPDAVLLTLSAFLNR